MLFFQSSNSTTSLPLLSPLDEKGVSMLELSVILPLLIIMIAGVIDFGIAFRSLNNLSTAARSGARAAAKFSLPATPPPNITYHPCDRGMVLNCNTMRTAPAHSVAEAAAKASCSYLDSQGLVRTVSNGQEEYVVEISWDHNAANLRSSLSNPGNQKITVEIKRNSTLDNTRYCLVCADTFVPGLKSENIRGKASFMLDGQCNV